MHLGVIAAPRVVCILRLVLSSHYGAVMPQGEDVDVREWFGQMMREAREKAGWSQRRLAELLNQAGLKIDHSALNRIENGQREARLTEAVAISDLLELNLQTLSWSGTAVFLKYEAVMFQKAWAARTALREALTAITMGVESLSGESEEKLLEMRKQKTIADVFRDRIDMIGRSMISPDGSGSGFVITYSDEDAEVKRRLVDAVVADILITDEEFERRIGLDHDASS